MSKTNCNNKTGRHDIAEILLKVALKHQKKNQSSNNKRIVHFTAHVLVCVLTNFTHRNIHFLACTIFKISQFIIYKPLNIIYISFIFL